MIPPGQTLLFSEPIFSFTAEDLDGDSLPVPLGNEGWLTDFSLDSVDNESTYLEEYLAIAKGLKDMGAPYRIIIAHREQMNVGLVMAILSGLGVRGLQLHFAMASTSFPRDMMVDFDGQTFLNPDANIDFPDRSGRFSPLGEGGRVLKSGRKILVPDPEGFAFDKVGRDVAKDSKELSERFKVGFLPHPLAVSVSPQRGPEAVFAHSHLDRVSSLIQGKDGKDYLLVESAYANSQSPRMGDYWPLIKKACAELEIDPVVVETDPNSIPCRMNMLQLSDNSVLLTGGDPELARTVQSLVGESKTEVTAVPIVNYPLFRRGGIRCMTLFAPERIVGQPLTS
jgi:hypothetical protein